MILKECFVSSFGKLKNFRYQFNESLNIINAENGFGKTTLSIFIKSMFYGLDDAKRDVDNNERKKYKPWNSLEKFGGYLVFEKNNTLYKIERFFGNKEGEDSCILTDLSTGKLYENYFDLGNRLFEIDEEGFNSTTFFSQKDFSVKSNTSLTAKYNDVCEVQDSVSFDKALLKVNNKLKEYKYSGDRGLIPDTKRKINQVEIEINSLSKASQYIVELKEQESKINVSVARLKEELKSLNERVSLSIKRQAYKDNENTYNRISAENNQILQKINHLKGLLNGKSIAIEELNVCQDSISQINSLINKREILNQDVNSLNLQKDSAPKQNKSLVILFICAICLIAVVGVVLFAIDVISIAPFIIILSVSLSLLGLWVYLIKRKNNPNALLEGFIENKVNELNEVNDCIEKYKRSLDIFFSSFNLNSSDYYSKLEELKTVITAIKECENNLSFNERTLKNLNFEPNNETPDLENIDANTLTNIHDAKNIELQELIKSQSNLMALIKQKEDEQGNLIFLENNLEELKELLKNQQEEMEILKITSNYLQRADESLKMKYKLPIQNALDKYLGVILDDQVNAQMDINFNLTINNNALSVQPEFFSKGYRNLFDICKRFALIEVLFPKEKPFVILDDPFSNLDNDKLNKSLAVIQKLSKEYQIIYFTCHDSRGIVGD